MTALVYGFVHAASSGWSSVGTIGAFAVGVVLLAAFVVERDAGRLADHAAAAVRRPQPRQPYVARLLLVAGMLGMFFFLSQFLRGVLGYSDLSPASHSCRSPSRCSPPRNCPHGCWSTGSAPGPS